MSSGGVKATYSSKPKLLTGHLFHCMLCVVKVLQVITYCHTITRKVNK